MPTDAVLITCVGVRFDLPLLPHFLTHYVGLGIDAGNIVCILNAESDDDPGLAAAEEVLRAQGVGTVVHWIAPYTSASMWAERRRVQDLHAPDGGWVISADVDEFHEYPAALPDFLDYCAGMGVDCVQGVFIDRLADGGALPPVRPSPAVSAQFPLMADAINALGGVGKAHNRLGTVKVMAMRGGVRPSRGGHHPQDRYEAKSLYTALLGEFSAIDDPDFRFAVPTRVHHYHWTATLKDRLEKRLATPGVSAAGAEYGQKQIDAIGPGGAIDLGRVDLRQPMDGDWQARVNTMRDSGRKIVRRRPIRLLADQLRARMPW